MIKHSYKNDEVIMLLKDISGMAKPLPAAVREQQIQNGRNYCEMIPLEERPSAEYMKIYKNTLKMFSAPTAQAISILAEKLYQRKGSSLVLVSLARAGIPIGILIKKYLKNKYSLDVKHYSISIIRGMGIDKNALDYILEQHEPECIQFIDGWTGKGAIYTQLKESLKEYPSIDSTLAVVADPAGLTDLCGTHEDILIPSVCLNATVSGLISRTFYREDIIQPDDFHGAIYYKEMKGYDQSRKFLREIEKCFDYTCGKNVTLPIGKSGQEIVNNIAEAYHVKNINYIKPGIGETTRVLLRRIPWKILISSKEDAFSEELQHIYLLAMEKNIVCERSTVDLGNYKACGIITQLPDI